MGKAEESFNIGVLNTLECTAEAKSFGDVKLMTCQAFDHEGIPRKTINHVASIEGDVAVMASRKPDTIYLKTTPWFSMGAYVEVIPEKGYPFGKLVRVKAKSARVT